MILVLVTAFFKYFFLLGALISEIITLFLGPYCEIQSLFIFTGNIRRLDHFEQVYRYLHDVEWKSILGVSRDGLERISREFFLSSRFLIKSELILHCLETFNRWPVKLGKTSVRLINQYYQFENWSVVLNKYKTLLMNNFCIFC